MAFIPDQELSPILSKLWDLDNNKCIPGVDYEIDLQGYVTSYGQVGNDFAKNKLFKWVDESKVFSRPTYKAFRALLDNYEMEVGKEEVVTHAERQENYIFLDEIMKTQVMREAHAFLVSKNVAPADVQQFKQKLYDIWFKLFRKRAARGNDSSSFEHVFVGEYRDTEMIGLHNWIQFYLQEKAGNINYHGYIRKQTASSINLMPPGSTRQNRTSSRLLRFRARYCTCLSIKARDDEIVRLLAVQFSWKDIKGKPMCSVFIGSSPEFEIAAYTIVLLLDKDGKIDVQLGEYETEINVKSFHHERKLGTAYFAASRLDQYAHK